MNFKRIILGVMVFLIGIPLLILWQWINPVAVTFLLTAITLFVGVPVAAGYNRWPRFRNFLRRSAVIIAAVCGICLTAAIAVGTFLEAKLEGGLVFPKYFTYWQLFWCWLVASTALGTLMFTSFRTWLFNELGKYVLFLWSDNNTRWFTCLALFAYLSISAVLYGPPTPEITLAKVQTTANEVWQSDTVSDVKYGLSYLWSSKDAKRPVAKPKPLFEKIQPESKWKKGWTWILFALLFGWIIVVYFPKACADDVHTWLISFKSKRDAATTTEEAAPVEGTGAKSSSWFEKLVGFSIVDLGWDAVIAIFRGLAKV